MITVTDQETKNLTYPVLNKFVSTLQLPNEIWKDIKGFESFYQISNLGRVKRLEIKRIRKNQVTTWEQILPEIIMKICNDSKGYPQVRLTIPTVKVARIHRLVAEGFLKEPSAELIEMCGDISKVYVNHKDENKLNPFVSNLEWCTQSYNSLYSVKNKKSIQGSFMYNSILTDTDVLEIVEYLKLKTFSQTQLGEMYNVKQITISNI